MCVSMAPAEFKGAIAFGGEVNERHHLLGYQNKAQSLGGANCMLLHVPTARLTADSLVPTTADREFMNDMSRQMLKSLMSKSRDTTSRGGGHAPKAIVVPYGAYEIVLANSARDIPEALGQVDLAKRPAINSELLDWYDQNFPLYSFILACFNNTVEKANHPILVQYTPMDPTTIFVPGLESHSGQPPTLGGRDDHDRDFRVVFGSRQATENPPVQPVRYTNPTSPLRHLLPTQVVGFCDIQFGTNTDYVVQAADVRNGVNGMPLFETMPAHTAGLDPMVLAMLRDL
jgi:hypothetical protein